MSATENLFSVQEKLNQKFLDGYMRSPWGTRSSRMRTPVEKDHTRLDRGTAVREFRADRENFIQDTFCEVI